MRIQTKITLLFFAIGTFGLFVMNACIFYFVSQFNFEDFFKRLEARVNLTAEINIHPDEKSLAYKEVRNRYLERLEDEQDYIIPIQKNGGFKKPLQLPDKFYRDIQTKGKSRYNKENRFFAGSVFQLPSGKYIVIVAASDPYGFKEIEVLRKVLVVVFLVSVVLIYFTGKFFSYYIVKPLREINKGVRNITATNLHLRLDEIKGKDEISELAQNFNHMLTRLETAFETQNNFVSNASHELRTPLAIISGETELLLNNVGALQPEVQESIKTVSREAEKLEQILTSLIGLAQSGFNGKKQNWQIVRVDELVLQAVEAVKKIETESTIDVDFNSLPEDESSVSTEGNVNLLQLAISNILLNACKYSGNKPVGVKLSSDGGRIAISVSDKGIGIPEEEQQHIFEPFFRASNTTDFEGYGIGLPLTLNIIRLHKGSIGIRSEENVGTEMNILLPVAF